MALVFKDKVDYISTKKKYVELFFIIFYIVGFIGIVTPVSHHIFLKLFPAALLMSFFTILLFHQNTFDVKVIAVLTLIGFWSFFIEVTGVNTHLIFGSYKYGNALGVKIWNTPLVIAINWVMLMYAGSSIADEISLHVSLKIFISSVLVLLYDLVLEQIAPVLDMWYWENNIVPVRNYVAWFIIALVFQTFIRISGIKTRNSMAFKIILIQVIFFISLIVFFKLFR